MKRKRSQSRRQSATCSAHGRTETNEVAESSGTKRSRSERGRLQSGLVLRRRSESRPPPPLHHSGTQGGGRVSVYRTGVLKERQESAHLGPCLRRHSGGEPPNQLCDGWEEP